MKKLFFALCFLLVLCCLLASCETQSAPTPESEKTPTSTNTDQTLVIDVHTHQWSAWETVTAPTCTASGVKKRTCACGESRTREIPIAAHSYNTDNVCTSCNHYLQGTQGLVYWEWWEEEDERYYTVGLGDALSYSTDVVIPPYYNGLPVMYFERGSWNGITSIQIPATVAYVRSEFDNCTTLQSVTFAADSTLEELCGFSNCTALTTVNIPASVTWLEAFSGCSALKNVTFAEDSKLEVVSGFEDCSALEEIYLPDTVEDIYAFCGCTALKIAPLPSGLRSLGIEAFAHCTALTEIVIPQSVIKILGGAFFGCSGLTSITVESGNAYYYSENNCLMEREGNRKMLFLGCKNSILPERIDGIIPYAFSACPELLEMENGITYLDDWVISADKSLEHVVLRDNVVGIADEAFFSCGLTSIELPDSLRVIGNFAFGGCGSLTSISLPNGLQSIGHDAFDSCVDLESIRIPDTVKFLGNMAFGFCENLKSITLSSALTEIPSHAFLHCGSLTSITLPAGITKIGNNAFAYCFSLASVTLPDGLKEIGANAFLSCSSLASIELPATVSYIAVAAFYGCKNLTSVVTASTTGWWINRDGTEKYVILGDPVQNAKLLSKTYFDYEWRSTSR